MDKNINKEFDETTSELLKTISSFSPDGFNKVPFEGSWTAGQTAEHILKSITGVPDVMMGGTAATERDPAEKEPQIRSIFLDFQTKMKSPDFILPTEEPKEKIELSASLEKTFGKIRDIITNEKLDPTCTDVPFPGMGEFTRYEWVCFAICHTKRHTHQLKNIYSRIKE